MTFFKKMKKNLHYIKKGVNFVAYRCLKSTPTSTHRPKTSPKNPP